MQDLMFMVQVTPEQSTESVQAVLQNENEKEHNNADTRIQAQD